MGRTRKRYLVWGLVATVVGLLVPAAVALAVITGTFNGKTSQHRNVTITISSNQVIQSGSSINWKAHCNSGGHSFGYTDFGGPMNGKKFHVHGSYIDYPGGPFEDKNTATVDFKVHGKKLKGTFTLHYKQYNMGTSPPKLVDRCKTGKLHFKAHS